VTPMTKEEVARHGREGWFGGGGDIRRSQIGGIQGIGMGIILGFDKK